MRSRPPRSLVAGLIAFCLVSSACSAPANRNVLLIVADDIGVDSLATYPYANESGTWPATPILDYLASSGVVFDNAWSSPTCTPTRAAILTGRYGTRTGVTGLVSPRGGHPLPLDEVTLPQALQQVEGAHIQSAAFGKWHLANATNGGPRHPGLAGFSEFRGQLFNLPPPLSYFDWPKLSDGRTARSRRYVTTDNVDEASAWIRAQRDPWFVYLAFNAAHWPWAMPPHALLPEKGEGLPPAGTPCGAPCREAMIEAMDHEIGRLLQEIGSVIDVTTVVFVADNGTPALVRPQGSPYPADGSPHPADGSPHPADGSPHPAEDRGNRLKGSLYQGGIHVPLIISGPTVASPGRRSPALVDATDLFATVLELMTGRRVEDVPMHAVVDSVSLVPVLEGRSEGERDFAFSVGEHGSFAIRDARYKLIRGPDGDALYDLADPQDRFVERNDLLLGGTVDPEVRSHHARLLARLDALVAPARP